MENRFGGQSFDELTEALSRAKSVAVLTGAGISAESGISTFRDPDGLWTRFSPQELASMDGFLRNSALVWEWYQYRRKVIHNAEPNPGHIALAEMQTLFPEFSLITQNVDRLHQRAGSTSVLEVHGNIVENYCSRCQNPHDYEYSVDNETKEIPRCTYCGGLIRPAVVWFGEQLPYHVFEHATLAAETCDVFLSIGTSAEVYPAAGLPFEAKRNGAFVAEINPHPTSISAYLDCVIQAKSGEFLPILVESVRNNKVSQKPIT